jgi:hypothetical protein
MSKPYSTLEERRLHLARPKSSTKAITSEEAVWAVARVGPMCPEEGQELLAKMCAALIQANSLIDYLEARMGLPKGGARKLRGM